MDACKTLAHALITSRLDRVSLFPYGIPRLQRVHTSTARLVTRTLKREHIAPVLNSLRWLQSYTGRGTRSWFMPVKPITGLSIGT